MEAVEEEERRQEEMSWYEVAQNIVNTLTKAQFLALAGVLYDLLSVKGGKKK